MEKHVKEAIIKDFKEALMLPTEEFFVLLPGRKTVIRAKEEILQHLFSRDEIQRMKNETMVYDNPRAIREVSNFEEMLHKVGNYFLCWEVESIEDAYELFETEFEGAEKKKFTALAERAKEIVKSPLDVRYESFVPMDVNSLTLDDSIKIASINEDNKGDHYYIEDFTVGKTYPVLDLGDGLVLKDDTGSPYHIQDVEMYYHLENN